MPADTPMVLVPLVPTEEMMRAWNEAVPDAVEPPHADGWTPPADTTFRARWQAALSAPPARMGALQPQAASVPTEQAGGPVVALFQHCTDDERWMVEAFGLTEFEKLSTDGHAGLADDLLRDAERADQRGEPGTGSRIRAASNFIKAAVSLRRKFPAPSTTSTAEQVALSASDRACYEYPGADEQPLRAAFVAGAVFGSSARPTPATPEGLENWKSASKALSHALADEREHSLSLTDLLRKSREYVSDALEAYEHSDGRELLAAIDAALQPQAQPAVRESAE